MTSKTPSIYLPILSQMTLAQAKVSPLFDRLIQIYYIDPSTKKTLSIGCSVLEIYKQAQRSLREAAGECSLVLKGSSVSSLFSKEPVADIDIHVVIDLKDSPLEKQLSTQRALSVSLLSSIRDLVIAKTGQAHLLFDHLLCEVRKNFLAQRKLAPFNVQTITFGSIPVEFSLLSVVTDCDEPLRNFDFNSGVLELSLADDDTAILSSRQGDLAKTLHELECRELTCQSPESIERKSIPRYLMKLIVSGYIDKDPDLFYKLFFASTEESAIKVCKEVEEACREKEISPSVGFLWIWILARDHVALQKLVNHCKMKLIEMLSIKHDPAHRALSHLVKFGKTPEVCWYLFMLSDSARFVLHREHKSVQLTLAKYPLFSDEDRGESLHFVIPFNMLERLTATIAPEEFFKLHGSMSHIEVVGDDAKSQIQQLFQECLTVSSVFPIFSSALTKCDIEKEAFYSQQFISWYEDATERERQCVPKEVFIQGLQYLNTQRLSDVELCAHLLLRFFTHVPLETLLFEENLCYHKPIVYLLLKTIPNQVLISLHPSKKETLLNAAILLLPFIQTHIEGDSLISEILLVKLMIRLYQLDKIGDMKILQCLHAASHSGIKDSARKYLKALLVKETLWDHPSYEEGMITFAMMYPNECIRILTENLHHAQRKGISWGAIFHHLLDKDDVFSIPKSAEILSELLKVLLSREEAQCITQKFFGAAALGDKTSGNIIEALSLHFGILPIDETGECDISPFELEYLCTFKVLKQKVLRDQKIVMNLLKNALNHEDHEKVLTFLAYLQEESIASCISLFHWKISLADAEVPMLLIIAEAIYDMNKTFLIGSILERASEVLGNICDQIGKQADFYFKDKKQIEAQEALRWQKLYKACAINLIDQPLFVYLFSFPCFQKLDGDARLWIDVNRFITCITHIEKTSFAKLLIAKFSWDPDLILEIVLTLDKQPEGLSLDSFTVIQSLISLAEPLILAAEPSSIADHMPLVHLMQCAYIEFTKDHEFLKENLRKLFGVLIFCSVYANESLRERIRDLYQISIKLAGVDQDSELIDISTLLFLLVEKALLENKTDEILSYEELFSDVNTLGNTMFCLNSFVSFSLKRLNGFALKWEQMISKAHRAPEAVRFSEGNRKLFTFYNNFFVDLGLMLPEWLAYPKEMISQLTKLSYEDFREKMQMIETFSKRVVILACTYVHPCIIDDISLFLKVLNVFSAEGSSALANTLLRFSKSYVDHLKTIPKNDIDIKHFEKATILTKSLIDFFKAGSLDQLDRKSMLKVVESFRNFSFHFQISQDEENEFFIHLLGLESMLTEEQHVEYMLSLATMILEKHESASMGDIFFFISSLARRDEDNIGVNPFLSAQPNYLSFHIDSLLLSHPQLLDAMILSYRLLFTKFMNSDASESEHLGIQNILKTFVLYMDRIISVVLIHKGKPTFSALERDILSVLEAALCTENNKADLSIISNALKFIIQEKSPAHFALRTSTRDQLKRYLDLFCRFCAKLRTIEIPADHSYYRFINHHVKKVCLSILTSHSKEMQKILGKPDFLNLTAFLTESPPSRK